ncbi:Ino eighty subunit 1 [Sphaceloma murrayae]|uniref:Ino eighty subunit 1 n=1 Tax=Sphaceloma murrayae TaxID=2082308 RepID=A0A2K1R2W5_9PEZI|nr:Ino eighty subunit 1 [Sphaceloma murrayae]
MAEPDSRSSLKHILVEDPSRAAPRAPTASKASPPPPPSERKGTTQPSERDPDDDPDRDENTPHYSAITTNTRRNANGSVSSVFSGNKIRHLKKEDGVPLWRKDIQFEFLQAIFEDDRKVFTRVSDRSEGHTFAEIYIDTLAQSSKTSKILKEKLVQDHASAITMAMVCLLVNVGRMNTTLNFFPEMRAQLRTYHSIPALQAHQDPHAYKQLQDAPRLKSILKGASEDEPQPGTLEEIRLAKRPRTNPVHLIFVLAQYAPKVTEMHFNPPRDFFDLVMRHTLSSKSRARAFLWLIWWYLESDYTTEDASRNPFGAGSPGDGTNGIPMKVPPLDILTEEQADRENVDTEDEKIFGEQKRKERIAIVASEPSPAMTALKRARKERNIFRPGYVPSEHEGTTTPGRDDGSPAPHGSVHSSAAHRGEYGSEAGSPSPPAHPSAGAPFLAPRLGGEETPSRTSAHPTKPKGPGRGNWRRNKLLPAVSHTDHPTLSEPAQNGTAPQHSGILPPRLAADILARSGGGEVPTPGHQSKKMRPLTTHQLAISEYRRSRVRRILERGVQLGQAEGRGKRIKEGAVLRAWMRCKMVPSGWDSEEEETKAGKEEGADGGKAGATGMDFEGEGRLFGRAVGSKGVVMNRPVGGVWMAGFVMPGLKEVEDVGEEYGHFQRVFERADRRLEDVGRDLDRIRERRFYRRKSIVEAYAEELSKDPLDIGARPRLVRKNVGRGRGRGRGRGGAGRGGARTEDGGKDGNGVRDTVEYEDEGMDGEEDEMDVDDTIGNVEDADQAELDEEDRELLGEVDAEESDEGDEDEDDDDGAGDEDAMDQS